MLSLQEVLAPFVVANLGCAGNETRLVDCPLQMANMRSSLRGTVSTHGCDYTKDAFTVIACGNGTLRASAGACAPAGAPPVLASSASISEMDLPHRSAR